MGRTLEAAPATLTQFEVEIVAGGFVVEVITMTNIPAEGPTWRGPILNALSSGFCKLNYVYNGAVTPSARYYANISPDDGTIAYARDFVYSDMVVNSTPSVTGGGARTILVTVTDDAMLPLEGAKVRLTKAAETFANDTDVAGQVVFNINDGTWIVAITLFGYTFPGATLVVNSDDEVVYEMIPLGATIPPTGPEFCVLRIRVWGANGTPAEGVDVHIQVEESPVGVGEIFDKSIQTETTAADGYVSFVVPRGSEIKYWVGDVEESVDNVGTDEDIVYLENQLGLLV